MDKSEGDDVMKPLFSLLPAVSGEIANTGNEAINPLVWVLFGFAALLIAAGVILSVINKKNKK